jgi:glycosyltransferase involved in cell wall biosynthesis
LPAVTSRPDLLAELQAIGDRFVFAQGYDNLAEVEHEPLRSRGHTVTVPLPHGIYRFADTWRGDRLEAVLLCPAINDGGYYAAVYRGIKETFGDLPHRIFGRQFGEIADAAVLPFLSDSELMDLYAGAAVFVYPSTEPRHVHYSPIEAMVVGTPVLFRRGTLLDEIAGGEAAGACADGGEMHDAAHRLIAGDREFADRIRASQARIVENFSVELARRQWDSLLSESAA